MNSEFGLTIINKLQQLRNELMQLESRDDIVARALQFLRQQISCQAASIFLFSKDGYLERIGIQGIAANGNPIESNWFIEERYAVDRGFTGKAASPTKNSGYGEIKWIKKFEKNQIENEGKKNYSIKLGQVVGAIALPLNGQTRTYGVLEIINKIDPKSKNILPDLDLSDNELYCLWSIQSIVATALSNVRRIKQTQLLVNLSQLLVKIPYNNRKLQKIYDDVAQFLISDDTSFSVCVIRLKEDDKKLHVVAQKKVSRVTWEGRIKQERELGDGIVGQAFASQKAITYDNIDEHITEFKNQTWIQKNNFKSFGCFPFITQKSEIVGTISLFSSYNYNFHKGSINFLNTVASLVAVFVQKANIGKIEESLAACERNSLLFKNDFQQECKQIRENYELAKQSLQDSTELELKAKEEQITLYKKRIDSLKENLNKSQKDFNELESLYIKIQQGTNNQSTNPNHHHENQ